MPSSPPLNPRCRCNCCEGTDFPDLLTLDSSGCRVVAVDLERPTNTDYWQGVDEQGTIWTLQCLIGKFRLGILQVPVWVVGGGAR